MKRVQGPAYALAITFWLLTSVYALLSSQAFVHEQFLKPKLLPPLALFAEWHAWLALAVFAITLVVRWPASRSRGRGPALLLLCAWGASAVLLLLLPPLVELGPGRLAPILAALALAPVAMILWAEWSAAPRPEPGVAHGERPVQRTSDDFFACVAAAVTASLLYALVSRCLGAEVASPPWSSHAALGLMLSLIVHLLLFLAVFCVLTLVRGVAEYFVWSPRRAEVVLASAALAGAMILVVRAIILPALSDTGRVGAAIVSAWGVGVALAIAVRGVAACDEASDGISRVLRPLVPRAVGGSPAATGLWLLALGVMAVGLAYVGTQVDWNRILSRLSVLLVWLLLLSACLRAVRPGLDRVGALYLAPVAVLAVHAGLASPLASRELARMGLDADAVRRSQLGDDPSFRLLEEILEPPARAGQAFFALLQRHTNISRSLEVDPVELSLARLEGGPAAYRPHVFVFVVDSLRRDYLSPYDPSVGFTPAIGRFAEDSTAFRHAFTRYGATGLSVPALWIGAPTLHKQYVTPFAPMNTLAKLIEHEGYAQWISMDNILDVILPPSQARDPLDANVMVKDFRFCRTLEEVAGRLATRADDDPPLFVYSLPQDIHISVVTREGSRSVDDGNYPGFSAPVASRIRRFDTCFGSFVDLLRAKGLYDDSLIVLTSDHGDSLGEEGRIGHAYGLFPEVIRIPLLVSLPARMRDSWVADVTTPAYNTDLTPTLYRLLGHELDASSALFGRPLFHPPGEPSAPRDRDVMVASSYGAVYGALLDSATRLYIVDTVNAREHGYDLGSAPRARALPVDGSLRRRGQAAIRETIQALADLYDFRPLAR